MPLISGRNTFEMLVRIDNWAATDEMLAADRTARARGEAPAMMPVVDEDPTAPSALPTPDSYEFFTGFEISAGAARDWFVEHLLPAVAAPEAAQA